MPFLKSTIDFWRQIYEKRIEIRYLQMLIILKHNFIPLRTHCMRSYSLAIHAVRHRNRSSEISAICGEDIFMST